MERRCENCGQPALPSDAVCWHCGWQLVEDEAAESPDKVTVRQGWQQTANLPAILVYAGLTALVIVLMLLVMGWLGRRPLIEAGSGRPLAEEWRATTPADQSFTLNLPEDWSWLDGSNPQQTSELAMLLEADETYQAATFPLGEELSDLAIVMVAAAPSVDDKEAFVIVATSRDLATLSQENVVQFLQEAEFDNSLVLAAAGDDTGESWPVNIVAEVIGEEGDHLQHCQQKLLVRGATAWLVSTCVPSLELSQHETVMTSILDSFQPLVQD